jgi:hypothetical protein
MVILENAKAKNVNKFNTTLEGIKKEEDRVSMER